MKIKKEYIIVAVIIVLSISYLILRNDSRVNYEVPVFTEIKKNEINAVSILGNGQSVELKKTGDLWTLEPHGYKVDSSQINRLLSEAAELSIVDLITNREDYERYELDDTHSIQIKISTKEDTVREFRLGKSSSSAIYSYISLPEEKGVYSVRGNLKNVFSLSLDTWRDKQVMKFDPESAAAIEISRGEQVVQLIHTAVTETPGWSLNGEVLINTDEIQNLVKSLGMLKSTGFIDGTTGEPAIIFNVTTAEQVHTLQVYEKLENGYSARSSYVDDSFLIPVYIGDQLMELF